MIRRIEHAFCFPVLLDLVCVGLFLAQSVLLAQSKPLTGKVGERHLRTKALRTEMPVYPQDAIRDQKAGVAVAEVELDVEGHPRLITVLEAPTPSIGESVRRALGRWQFQPFDVSGEPALIRGRLTFYFVLKDGKGQVFNPEDAPYVGRWPEKPLEKR